MFKEKKIKSVHLPSFEGKEKSPRKQIRRNAEGIRGRRGRRFRLVVADNRGNARSGTVVIAQRYVRAHGEGPKWVVFLFLSSSKGSPCGFLRMVGVDRINIPWGPGVFPWARSADQASAVLRSRFCRMIASIFEGIVTFCQPRETLTAVISTASHEGRRRKRQYISPVSIETVRNVQQRCIENIRFFPVTMTVISNRDTYMGNVERAELVYPVCIFFPLERFFETAYF